MEEKRLSIRFRMDNPQDKEAWELLQRISEEENTSKNAIALKLISKGAANTVCNETNSLNLVAEKIAVLVADKIAMSVNTGNKSPVETSTIACTADQKPQDDEFRAISKDALSFLDEF